MRLQLLLIIASCGLTNNVFAQQEQRYSRFQFHKYKWRVFHTKAFHVYFPRDYDSLGAFITKELPPAIKKVKHTMGTTILKVPNIIIYPSVDQLYESNIGMYEQSRYSFPTFLLKGNRIVIAYNGHHSHLKEQLYEGIARSIWDAQIKESGSGITDTYVPYWFKEGAIKYFAHQWPISSEDQLKRSFAQNDFKSWEEVISHHPKLSGHAFCYFLTQRYYSQSVAQIYAQLKKKNLQRSIRLITKRPLDSLFRECYSYYKSRFPNSEHPDSATAQPTAIKHKKGAIRNLLVSRDTNYIAYTNATYNKRTVFIHNLRTGKAKRITKYPLAPWVDDHSANAYPLLAWNESNQLIVTLPEKGKLRINNYSVTGTSGQGNTLLGADGVNSIVPVSGREYAITAFRNGQSDIVGYDINKEKYSPYLSDKYDDGSFTFNKAKGNTLLFTSMRPDREYKKGDSVKIKQGIYSLNGKKAQPLLVDSIPYTKWDKPIMISGERLLVTHTSYGTERFAVIDNLQQPGNIKTLTDYRPFQYLRDDDQVMFYRSNTDSLIISKQPAHQWIKSNLPNDKKTPWLEDYETRKSEEAKIDSILNAAKDDTPSFAEGILVPVDAKERSKKRADSISRSLDYDPKKVKPYILQLHSAYFTAKVNNDYFINRYQPYLNYQGQFKFPEIGGMVQGGFTDLFENHHINIAFRLPAGSEGSDFFVKYENTAKKLDWGLTYFRKVESLQPDPGRNWVNENGKPYPNAAKVKTHYYEVSLKYPITYDLSVGLQTAVRNDRTIFLATERYSLNFEDIKSIWSINTLSFTLNKLKPTVPFLNEGFRGKALIDFFKGFSQDEPALIGTGIQMEYNLPLYRYITLVAQGRAGYSSGDHYLLYNISGTDNNVIPRIDSTVRFPQTPPYAFQTLVTPFRGYLQNKLYGNEYALFNADLYFPLFQTLIPLETPLKFINLLQPGLFTDIATAKETWNMSAINSGWLWSYGISLRTMLANYPIRFDVAWPGTMSKKPVWYFSLNLK